MRRLGLFAAGIAALLAILIGASYLTRHHTSTEVPVVTADTRPIRVKPENPGGMKIDGAENDVFSGGADTANARLASAAETPDTKAFRTGAPSAPPIAPVPAAQAPVAQAPVAPAPVAPAPVSPAPVAVAPPLPAKPAVVASVSSPQDARPTAAAATPGKAMVQLAALGSEAAAHTEWQLLTKKLPDLLNGHQPTYSHTEHDGHTFWRLRTSGFADVAQARTFCEHVRAKGAGCSVADF
jgi:hypothetical protein